MFFFVVIILTARMEGHDNRKETKVLLKKIGVDIYEALYMMPVHVKDIIEYKKIARQDVAKRHNIIASVGDMWWDIIDYPMPACMKYMNESDCAILFPVNESVEVGIKLPGSAQ